MAKVLTFIQGNTKEKIKFTVYDRQNNQAVDLTGCTITLSVFKEDFSEKIFGGSCTITDATNGECEYQPASGDMDTVGTFLGELHIVFPDLKEARIQGFRINITRQAPS